MVVATDLVERLARADVDLWVDWHRAVEALPENPYGVQVRSFGGAVALLIHGVPHPYFNRVVGMGASDAGLLHEISNFYRQRQTPSRVDVNPFGADESLLQELNSLGYRPSEFQTNLWTLPSPPNDPMPRGVTVREVAEEELEFFATLYERAYNHGRGVPHAVQQFRIASTKARFRRDGWRFFLGLVDGIPAGGGVLHISDEVASLTGGATIYTLRGRGCQRALLLHRLAVAAAEGCEIVVSRCAVGSPSQRNMERCGMTTAYTKLIWQCPVSSPNGKLHRHPVRSSRPVHPLPEKVS
jgi:GNAT superfamily N-acetyltransferase